MPDSDPLAQAALLLDEAVTRLERASAAAPPAPDRVLLAQAAARLEALIRRLDAAIAPGEAAGQQAPAEEI